MSGSGKCIFGGAIHTALVCSDSIRYFPWNGFNRYDYFWSFRNSVAFYFCGLYRNCRDFFLKATLQGCTLEQNSAHLTFFHAALFKAVYIPCGAAPWHRIPAAFRLLRRCAGYAIWSVSVPSALRNAFRKEGGRQRSTAWPFESRDTQPKLKSSHNRIFSPRNQKKLQSGIVRSTKKVTKQNDS